MLNEHRRTSSASTRFKSAIQQLPEARNQTRINILHGPASCARCATLSIHLNRSSRGICFDATTAMEIYLVSLDTNARFQFVGPCGYYLPLQQNNRRAKRNAIDAATHVFVLLPSFGVMIYFYQKRGGFWRTTFARVSLSLSFRQNSRRDKTSSRYDTITTDTSEMFFCPNLGFYRTN